MAPNLERKEFITVGIIADVDTISISRSEFTAGWLFYWGFNVEPFVFGFIGFFLREKNWHHLDWFIPAFIEAVKDHPSAVLLLIGGGPGRDDIEEIGQSMGFRDRMIFTGAIDNVGIGNYIDAMDIGVIPHTNEYRSPIKLFRVHGVWKTSASAKPGTSRIDRRGGSARLPVRGKITYLLEKSDIDRPGRPGELAGKGRSAERACKIQVHV